ncbi:MAG: dienelactone hydrolase family protein [Pseudomonadota bacterium]
MSANRRMVEYDIDGSAYDGLLTLPKSQSGASPAVMVCHAWGGRKEHEEQAAERIAELGYVGFAADVYGVGRRGETPEESEALMTPLLADRETLRTRLLAAIGQLKAQEEVDVDQVVIAGYCFGGLCAIDMARINAPVLGAAAFHSIFGTEGTEGPDITPKVIAFQGYDDPMADPDAQRAFTDEMTARNADWQMHLYGGVAHSFTNRLANDPANGLKYDVTADARSWAAFENFLAEIFGS